MRHYRLHQELVELLITQGADVDGPVQQYCSPLAEAIENSHGGIVQMLMSAGADVNTKKGGYGHALSSAVRQRDKGMVIRLLRAGADVNLPPDCNNDSALCKASELGDAELTRLLIDEGADIYFRRQSWAQSALDAAAKKAPVDIIRVLLKEVDIIKPSSETQHLVSQAFLTAAQNGRADVVRFFLDEALEALSAGIIAEALKEAVDKDYHGVVDACLNKRATRL